MFNIHSNKAQKSKDVQGVKRKGKAWDTIIESILFICGAASILILFAILGFLVVNSTEFFGDVNFWDFLTGDRWLPGDDGRYGAYPLIMGTLLVTVGAMAISIPLGIGAAIYIAELAPPKVKNSLKLGIELLSGIPSVVFGLFGLIMLTSWLRISFSQPTGETWAAGSIILGIMALPTIISVSEDAISSVPREMREASYAMGATRWQTISKVVLPAAMSGVTAAIILGMGRAVGETMAVMMVCGNAAVVPEPIYDVFTPIRTITSALGTEMGEAWGVHRAGLFALAIILFVIVLVMNFLASYLLKRIQEKQMGIQKRITNKRRFFGLVAPARQPTARQKERAVRIKETVSFALFALITVLMLRSIMGMGAPGLGLAVMAVGGIMGLARSRIISFRANRTSLSILGALWVFILSLTVIIAKGHISSQGILNGLRSFGVILILICMFISMDNASKTRNALPSAMVYFMLWVWISWFEFFEWYGGAFAGVTFFYSFFMISIIYKQINIKLQERLALGFVNLSIITVVLFLGIIIFYIVKTGIGVISWEFLTEPPKSVTRQEGGIFPAIVGTLYLVMGAIAFAFPLGVGAGIYLAEYAKKGRIMGLIRAGIDNLNGTPSIVFGLFGYALFLIFFGWQRCLLAGQLTLGFMILPTIIKTTEESLKTVPQSIREGSLALGASKWRTIYRVVLPPSMPGIITGSILSIGRAAGETAPILFTTVLVSKSSIAYDSWEPVMALPYTTYTMAMDIPGGMEWAAGAGLVLFVIVGVIYGVAAYFRQRFIRKTRS